jgi:hypothetical protein
MSAISNSRQDRPGTRSDCHAPLTAGCNGPLFHRARSRRGTAHRSQHRQAAGAIAQPTEIVAAGHGTSGPRVRNACTGPVMGLKRETSGRELHATKIVTLAALSRPSSCCAGVHPWPSSPTSSVRSCWRARTEDIRYRASCTGMWRSAARRSLALTAAKFVDTRDLHFSAAAIGYSQEPTNSQSPRSNSETEQA